MVRVLIPESLQIETVGLLPANWTDIPAPSALRDIGTAWANSRSSAILRVPSVVVRADWNYLINPEHPAAGQIASDPPQPWHFDPRLYP